MVTRFKENRVGVATYNSSEELDSALLIAGCDPAASLMADWMARRRSPARVVPMLCSSRRALDALVSGFAHCAGVHLKDPRTGEFNLESIRRTLHRGRATVVTFARWELGFAVRAGNTLGISSIADLGGGRIRVVNREKGSGARVVLDSGLKRAGIHPNGIGGYHFELGGHLEVGNAIASGLAEAGVTIRVAADAYGLEFVPLQEERYDLAILEADADTPPIRAMLDALSSRRFAREISQFCGYDTETMGNVVARLSAEAA
jgi:molybdate-binding protein